MTAPDHSSPRTSDSCSTERRNPNPPSRAPGAGTSTRTEPGWWATQHQECVTTPEADQLERRTIGARRAMIPQHTTTAINARVRVNACAVKPINGGPARSPA